MSFAAEAQKVLDVTSTALHGLEAVGVLTKGLITNGELTDKALSVVRAIAAIVDSVQAGFNGTATVDDINKALQRAKDQIAANDKAADDALDSKFPR